MTKPRIAIDMRYAAPPLSGFGRYTWNLLDGLARIGPPEPILLLRRPGQGLPADVGNVAGFLWRDVDGGPYQPLGQAMLARSLAAEGIRLMVSPDSFAPLAGPLRQVTTIHDIIPLRCPTLLHRSAKGRYAWLWRQWLRLQIKRVDLVHTVSDHARVDIGTAFQGAEGKLRTVYNAVTPSNAVASPPGADGVARLLYVGRSAPYKNIVGCIETVAALRRSGLPATLTIVGEPDPRYPEPEEAIRQLGLENSVAITGHVDEAALQAFYRDASVFLFLSRYEGFGLPPLEAMAAGVPVVSSDRASMPEVLGDAALLIDPDDAEAVVEAVRRVIKHPDLARTLRERGLTRAASFTTERQARMFWDTLTPLLRDMRRS